MRNAHCRKLIGRNFAYVLALKLHGAGAAAEHSGNSFKRRGFSRAVCADKGDDFSLVYFKRNAFYCVDGAVIYIQIGCFKQHFMRPPS